jgi:hypothetical protein
MIPFLMKRSSEPCEFGKYPVVADGLLLPNGMTVIAWRGEHPSLALYASPEDMMAVHGHGHTAFTARDDTWELILDPWHRFALAGTPAEGQGRAGKRQAVWCTVDWVGNPTGVIGPAVEVAAKPEAYLTTLSAILAVPHHKLGARGGPVCQCGQPSRHESGWCGQCTEAP